ncbi:MAG TPA: MFS transporter [Chthoniobacterales bacterium]|nr:MFS transporter [Chthoniobacterales bacterium]
MNRLLVRTHSSQDQKSFRSHLKPALTGLKTGGPGKLESDQAERKKWISLLVLLVGPFLGVIDFFIANIGIPSIKGSLHAGFSEAELIVAGYGLTYAVCLITGGRLGDIFGRKKVFIFGMAGFTATSAFCGWAGDAGTLVFGRLLQGCAAAVMFPQALSFIQVNFTGSAKRLAFSIYGAMIGFGSIVGQILGGFLIQADLFHLGWRPIFLINLPLGLITILAASLTLGESKAKNPPGIDVLGTVLLSIGLFLFSLPFMEGTDAGWPPWAWGALAASIPFFFAFYRFECGYSLDGGSPLIEPRLFQDRGFMVGILVTCIYFAGHTSMLLVLSLFLQLSLRLDPFHAGLLLAPFSFGFLIGSSFSGKLNGYFGRSSLHLGAGILAISLVCMSIQANGSHGHASLLFVLTCFIYGIGRGLVTAPLYNTVLSGVPARDAGFAAGVASMAQQVANSVGIAVIGAIVFSAIPSHATAADYAHGFVISSLINLLLLAIASLLLLLIPKSRGRDVVTVDTAMAEA